MFTSTDSNFPDIFMFQICLSGLWTITVKLGWKNAYGGQKSSFIHVSFIHSFLSVVLLRRKFVLHESRGLKTFLVSEWFLLSVFVLSEFDCIKKIFTPEKITSWPKSELFYTFVVYYHYFKLNFSLYAPNFYTTSTEALMKRWVSSKKRLQSFFSQFLVWSVPGIL